MTELRGNRFGISHTPQEILTLIEGIAEEYGLCSPRQRLYYAWDWTTLRQINLLSPSSIKMYLGGLRRDRQIMTYPSVCGANYLRVKNHYLGFYQSKGFIIKAFLNPDSYQRHIDGVQRFGEFRFNHIKAPRIQNFGLNLLPHTLESYIGGNNYQIIALDFEKELIEELADFHFHHPREIEVFISDEGKKEIVEYLMKHNLNNVIVDQVENFLNQSSWSVIEGEIHGDINQGNFIRGKEGVYLIDWEFYSRGPVAQDLVKLYYQAGEDVRQKIMKVYQSKHDSIKKSKNTSDFLTSLLLYSLKTLLNLIEESREQLIMVHNGLTNVDKKTTNYEQSLLSSIQTILVDYEKRR